MSFNDSENLFFPVMGCLTLSGLFVGSLYLKPSAYNRNHSTTIKQRFCCIFFVVIISPFILKMFITSEKYNKFSTLELLGFRWPGIFPAAMIPLLLTMILFLGPLCLLDYRIVWQLLTNPKFWGDSFTDLIWLRNVIVGPLSEEFTFRACMMPLLLQCFETVPAVFVCSLFFGLAHVHHVIESYKRGEPYKILFIRALIQFSYTSLFGGYSAYLFVQTGHFIAPFLVHSFCNIMSFPDFEEIFMYENPKRLILIILFAAGLFLWYILLKPFTNHELYSNYIYHLPNS